MAQRRKVKVCPGSVFGLSEKRRLVLQHNAIQPSVFSALAFVVDLGAKPRPMGLPADGLHARHSKW